MSEKKSPEYDAYDVPGLNLGVESSHSILETGLPPGDTQTGVTMEADPWARAGIAVNTNVLPRRRSWRSTSSLKRRRSTSKKDVVDGDCGICFETAVMPCRTLCCGSLFCLEHIADWLHGPKSNGRCPTCQSRCSLAGSSFLLGLELNTASSAAPPSSKSSTPRPRSRSRLNETSTAHIAQFQETPTSPTPSTSSLLSEVSNASSASNFSMASSSTWASSSARLEDVGRGQRLPPSSASSSSSTLTSLYGSSTLRPHPRPRPESTSTSAPTSSLPLSKPPHPTNAQPPRSKPPLPPQPIHESHPTLISTESNEWNHVIGRVLGIVGLVLLYYVLLS